MVKSIIALIDSINRDKLLHFICAFLVAQLSYVLLAIVCPKRASLLFAAIAATVVSALKEIWDIKHGVPSWSDFIADEVGILIGLLVMALT